MTSSATAARNSYLTEVQATTEKNRKHVVRFTKFLHHTTHCDLGQLFTCQTAHATTRLAKAAHTGYLTEVQAATEKLKFSNAWSDSQNSLVGSKSKSINWDFENFLWQTEVQVILLVGPKSVPPNHTNCSHYKHSWSDQQNSFTAPLTMTGSNSLTRHIVRVTSRPLWQRRRATHSDRSPGNQ